MIRSRRLMVWAWTFAFRMCVVDDGTRIREGRRVPSSRVQRTDEIMQEFSRAFSIHTQIRLAGGASNEGQEQHLGRKDHDWPGLRMGLGAPQAWELRSWHRGGMGGGRGQSAQDEEGQGRRGHCQRSETQPRLWRSNHRHGRPIDDPAAQRWGSSTCSSQILWNILARRER